MNTGIRPCLPNTEIQPASLPELVTKMRAQRGLSRSELARRAGTTGYEVLKIETGRARPRTDTLERLLGALKVELQPVILPWEEPDTVKEGGE